MFFDQENDNANGSCISKNNSMIQLNNQES